MKKQKPNKVDYSKLVEPIMTEDNVIVGYKNVDEKPNMINNKNDN